MKQLLTFFLLFSVASNLYSQKITSTSNEKVDEYTIDNWTVLAEQFYQYKNYEKALYWHTKAAEKGSIYSQKKVALMYALPEGTEQDVQKSIYWYTAAAKQGDVNAQNDLGYMHMGFTPDYEKSLYWLKKAAEQGSAYAHYYIGYIYINGLGVPKDEKMARYWWTKGCELGKKDDQGNCDALNNPSRAVQIKS